MTWRYVHRKNNITYIYYMEYYGFIITRHVNTEKTNKYWNECVRCIRRWYPYRKIIIIDDNSNQELVKPEFNYKNVEIIQSEYPGRGELLPFIYFLKHHWFENAVIIHDSVFFHKRIQFESFKYPVMPFWHFNNGDNPDQDNSCRIALQLKNSPPIVNIIRNTSTYKPTLGLYECEKWFGVFGVQCFINYEFLSNIQNKYNITNLLNCVTNRTDRCSLERVMSLLFYIEYPNLKNIKSVYGDIFKYLKWGYTYDEYIKQIVTTKKVIKPLIKVWTGR